MRHLPVLCLIFLLLLSVHTDCRTTSLPQADIRKEFVQFDQSFLPVLFYVSEGNSFEAKRAVFHLGYHWQQLQQRYQMKVNEPLWTGTFARVDKCLNAAFFAIDANRFEEALTKLEQVKWMFSALRANYKIDYYLDHLYKFQAQLTELNEVVSDEMLNLMEWEDVMAMSVDLNRQWNVVMAKQVDADLLELDNTQLWKLRVTKQAVNDAMDKLNAAMDAADREQVADASQQLNLALLEMLRLFGNFEQAATYYADMQ